MTSPQGPPHVNLCSVADFMCMLRRVHHMHVCALFHAICTHACKNTYLQNVPPCFLVVVGVVAKLLEMLEVIFGDTAEKFTCVVEYLQGSSTKLPPRLFDEHDIYFEHLHKLNMGDVPKLQLLLDKGLLPQMPGTEHSPISIAFT